ncbi:MAG: hypothetical protein Q8K24_05805 [Hydrogenophaga sp.]|nr:hypothetical protein [Hydrogenophaga sp.]
METVIDISDVRRENLRRVIANNGGPVAVAKRIGHANASYLVQMAGPHPTRKVSEKTARLVERSLDMPERSLDVAAPIAVVAPALPAAEPGALSAEEVGRLILMVGRVCEAESVALPTPKFADVVALAMAAAAAQGGQPREDHVKALVRLAK